MTRKLALSSACLFAFAWGLGAQARPAQAQAGTGGTTTTPTQAILMGTIRPLLTAIGDTEYTDNTTYRTPVNKAQCTDNDVLHFTVSNIPNTHKYLEVWVGNNCSDADRSTRLTVESRCLRMTSVPLTTGETTVLSDVQVPPELACDESMQGNRWIWFLAVDAEMSQTSAPDYGAIQLSFDLDPPEAPTDVEAGNGETELPVSWDPPAGDPQYYHLLIDPSATLGGEEDGGSTGDCSSALMSAGQEIDPDNPPEGLRHVYIDERRTSETLDGRNYPNTKLIAVAVIADDLGHNHSELSQIACIHIVKTKGFWETYRENGGTVEPGCTCSVPGARGGGLATGLALGALGLIAWSRRVRRRR